MKKLLPYIIVTVFFSTCIFSLLKIYTVASVQSNGSFISTYFEYYSTIFLGSFFLLIGTYYYIKKTNSIVITNFFYLMAAAGSAIAFSKSASLGFSPAKEIEIVSVGFAPYFLTRFFEYFPSSSKPNFFHKFKSINLVIGIIITFVYFLQLLLGNHLSFPYVVRIGLIVNICLAIITCVGLIALHLNSNQLWIKTQLYLLMASLILAFAPVLFLSLIPSGVFHITAIPFYYPLNSIVILPIALSYLLTQQEIIDLNLNIKKYIFRFCSIMITISLLNLLLSLTIHDKTQLLIMNLAVIGSIAVLHFFERLFAPLKMKSWRAKANEIHRERQRIFQQTLEKKHLVTCAKLIVDLVHRVIEVQGASIIWKKDSPVVLYSSGVLSKESNRVLSLLLQLESIPVNIEKIESYTFFPLLYDQNLLGWMVIGQKENMTKMDSVELNLLKQIQLDALELLYNADSLHRIENDLIKFRKSSDMFDHFNTLLIDSLEEEKKRLSIFLHDEVLQSIIFLLNKLNRTHKENEELRNTMENVIYEIREMCDSLHPVIVEDLGLKLSLQALKRKIQLNHNLTLKIQDNMSMRIIPSKLAVYIFRMVKELIYNSIKHSSCSSITVTLQPNNDMITIIVEDNGKGFEMSDIQTTLYHQNSLGLVTIQKRVELLNGSIHIASKINAGTIITISLPTEWRASVEHLKSITS